MIDLRTRLLLGIGGVVLLIALIIGGIFIGKKSGEQNLVNQEPETEELAEGQPFEPEEIVIASPPSIPAFVPQTTEEKQALYVRQLARDFVERFLSFSNKNNDKHLADVETTVTASMFAWVQLQTAADMPGTVSQETKVISTSVQKIEGDLATVSVGAQQTIKDDSGTKTVYKKGTVDLLRVGGTWKVDGLFWEQ